MSLASPPQSTTYDASTASRGELVAEAHNNFALHSVCFCGFLSGQEARVGFFQVKTVVKLILVALNTTTSFPGFSPTVQGRAGKNPGNEFVNIRLSALLSLCS